MDKVTVYDAIIVGAGPAGLAVGSELSKNNKILVIDKNQAGYTPRSWFVSYDVVDDSVKPFTYDGVRRFLTNTYSGAKVAWEAQQFPYYPYVNEKTLLPHWVEVIQNNGSAVISECAYQEHNIEDGIVTVNTAKGTFKARLLVDASGYDSPIVKKYHIDRGDYYWWSVYGWIAEHPNGLQDLKVGDYMMWQTFKDTNADLNASLQGGRPVFEYEILNENTSFTLILYLRAQRVDKDFMEKEFMHIIRNEASTSQFHGIVKKEIKFGWYPSGQLSQQIAEDNVAFIGDAGCWTTPCGWGMSFILRNYKGYSATISRLLAENKLDKNSLLTATCFHVHQKYEVLLNAVVTHFLSNASAPLLDKFIGLFETEYMQLLCEKIFTLTITEEEVISAVKPIVETFTWEELAHVLPKKDFKLLVELAAKFTEDLVVEELHELHDKVHKHNNPQPELNQGMDFSPDGLLFQLKQCFNHCLSYFQRLPERLTRSE